MSWATATAGLDALRRQGVLIVVFEAGSAPVAGRLPRHRDLSPTPAGASQVAVTTNGTQPLDVPADLLW